MRLTHIALSKELSVVKTCNWVEQGSLFWVCMVLRWRLIVEMQVPSQVPSLVRFQLGLGFVRQFLSVTGQLKKPFISVN